MSGPLDGIRVIDLSMLLPGPLCSQHLADMGADVIKIENPRVPDMTRYFDAQYSGTEKPEASKDSAMFRLLNRNKKSVNLNVMRPEGREVLL
jgi:crotonobetainyl-CoA:carnitine CoA-transferase CaiB-like acyl-CoA transferase